MSLEELRQKRLRWVKANRENDFEEGIGRLLTELYPDNAHFIYELLQNAEDAKATEVRFTLKEDSVEFKHNGSQLFTLGDVESITSIGVSTKRDDPTNIGKFGVGFKAVFAYTNTPEITSGKYHFRIRDLVVPDTEGLSPCALGEKETHFSFPFDNPQKSPENACTEIEENLRQLNESTLLFLNNIRKIEYLLPDSSLGFLERRETDGNRIEILVQHPEDSRSTSVFFLRFEKTVDVNDEDGKPKSCRVAIAFGLEKTQGEEWKIKPLEPGRVCIYFPAAKETSNLRFHLHAPFASTVARDSVRDCPANNELRDHLANLIAESMTVIRDQKLLTVTFLAALPNDKDNLSSFYLPIQERLVEAFQNQKLVPMKQGGHAAADRIFRGAAQLSALISDNDLAIIEEHPPPLWIANPQQRNQQEDHFLSLLGIPEWRAENLVAALEGMSEASENVCPEWFAEKSDDWLQGLYSLLGDFLSNAPSRPSSVAAERKDKLSKLRIVLCSDGKYRSGDECYFPSDDVERDEDMPRVVKGTYSSGTNKAQKDKARRFLEDIGVRKVGEAEQVEAILKRRYSKGSVVPHEQDMKRFIALVEKEPDRASLFSEYYIFQLEDEKWGKWGKPSIVFLDSPYLDTGLKAYYEAFGKGLGRKQALSPKYKESGIEPEKLGGFAKKVGAQTKLEPKEQSIPSEHPEKGNLRDSGGWSWSYGINEDYDIPELCVLLAGPDLSKSKLVWVTMKELSDDFFEARYRSNSWHSTKTANSSLIWKLRTNSWVPQEQGIEGRLLFVKPSEAVRDLLPSGFPFDNGAKWLEAIQFGKAEQDRKEQERQKKEQATWEYQRKSEAAETLEFSSVEEVQEAKQMLELKREDPEGFKKWEESRKPKPTFPEKPSRNPERRQEKLVEQYANASEKEYETRPRSVRTTRGTIDPDPWLKSRYTNDADQMICQICKEEMPFKKRDDEYYFESVEALSKGHFNKEHEAQFLALCPLCAAMYTEFVKNAEGVMLDVKNKLADSTDLEIPLRLGELETSIRFVETHRQDMRTILDSRQDEDSPSP